MPSFFGYKFNFGGKNQEEDKAENLPGFSLPSVDDGTITVAAGGSYGTVVDLDGSVRNEAQLITKYRSMALHSEIDSAILDIINDMIILDPEKNQIVECILDSVDEIDDPVKEAIINEFKNILLLLHFNIQAHDVARRYYIDGRMYWHAVIDPKDTSLGIRELRYLDPRKIRKIREVTNKRLDGVTSGFEGSETIQKVKQEYYIYNEKGFEQKSQNQGAYTGQATSGIKIAPDAVIYTTSGIVDENNKVVLSHLNKAIKPLNMLKSIEDAALIYRLARAPDRRIFYIDTGNLPRLKAEEYLRDMMVKHKNRLSYDSSTGEIRDERKHMTLLEDYWFPRRADGRTTEVSTLPGGQNQGVLEEIEYFRAQLYKSLNVPFSRTNPDASFSMGRATEISRDEVKFSKFIDRLQISFSDFFVKILRVQLALKQIMSPEEFDEIKYKIQFRYSKDNMFEEMKKAELRDSRMTQLQVADQFASVYFSHYWIKKNILMQSDREIAEILEQQEQEQELAQAKAIEQNPAMLDDPEQQQAMDQQNTDADRAMKSDHMDKDRGLKRDMQQQQIDKGMIPQDNAAEPADAPAAPPKINKKNGPKSSRKNNKHPKKTK